MRKWVLVAFLLCGFAVLLWWVVFAPVPGELQNQRWLLQSIETIGGQITFTWNDPRFYYVEFSADGKATGRAACNAFNGRIYSIRFTARLWGQNGSFFRNLMNCAPITPITEDWEAKETAFLNNLMSVTHYTLQGEQLRIYFDQSRQVMIFRPAAR